jgi:hypothetical protein
VRIIFDHDRAVLMHGDCHDLDLPENSVDALIFDPPAGIAFMGAEWDKDKGGRDAWIAWLAAALQRSIAALKPGGHALCWALPRTSHWAATALEDAGLEIRDLHHHIFGTGFPKSLTSASAAIPEGSGTALKPAVEHWILARKPLDGTVGEVFATHGTGVLNIDACRIGHDEPPEVMSPTVAYAHGKGDETGQRAASPAPQGRWPAHLSLEHAPGCMVGSDPGERVGAPVDFHTGCTIGCPVLMLDEQSGACSGRPGKALRGSRDSSAALSMRTTGREHADKVGASRFFYVAKGSRSEKDAGLEHLPKKSGGEATGREDGSAGTQNPRAGAGRTGGARNFHPTVKSIELMRWLVRLITPPGGTVLDMFAGSGTTGVAALAEGCSFVGVEQGGGEGDPYLPILVGRIRHALDLPQETP